MGIIGGMAGLVAYLTGNLVDRDLVCERAVDMKRLSGIFMWGAAISVALAAVGYLGTDIWLASTQWLLVAAVLALFGGYLKLS